MLSFTDNWYPCTVEFDGMSFPSAENAFQATRFVDKDMRRKFTRIPASKASYDGQMFKTTVPDWNAARYGILYEILKIKFSDPELKRKLIGTGDRKIISANMRHENDTGVCMCSRCRGQGLNATGLLLEKIRAELQAQDRSVRNMEDTGYGRIPASVR